MPAAWFDGRESGRLHSRVMRDVEQVAALVNHCYHGLLHAGVVVLVAVVVTALNQPLLLLCYALVMPMAYLLSRAFERRLAGDNLRYRRNTEQVAGRIGDTLRMLPYVRSHGVGAHESARCQRSLSGLLRRGIRLDRLTATFDAVT
jgi:ATP-binding cassette subfamily B protein